MKIVMTWGQVRAELRAERNSSQRLVDVKVNGAARPFTLIGRAIVDNDPVFGNKAGRMRGGWQFARTLGRHRWIALAYATTSGLPVAPSLVHAPAYSWWPQRAAALDGHAASFGPTNGPTSPPAGSDPAPREGS